MSTDLLETCTGFK